MTRTDTRKTLRTPLKRIALAFVMAAALGAPANASADTSQETSAVLTNVAEHVSHGFADKSLTMPQLEAHIAAGGHVSVLCGQVSMLGVRALQRAGVPARYVGAFASERADLMDVPAEVVESHAMLEAWTGSRWELYDLDSNVQPVDADGKPITLLQFIDMPERRYRTLATDPLYDPTDDQYPRYEEWVFSNHEAWYDRVLSIPAIYQGDGYGYAYTGPRSSPVADIPGYTWVSADALATYATWEPRAAAPKPGAPSAPPAPAAVPVTAAVASPAVAIVPIARPAVAAKRVIRPKRFVTKVRHGKVFHVYGKGRKARWVYVRRVTRH